MFKDSEPLVQNFFLTGLGASMVPSALRFQVVQLYTAILTSSLPSPLRCPDMSLGQISSESKCDNI